MHRVIIGVLVPALLILLYGVAARARPRRELATASRILEYHVVIKAFGWLLFACTTALFIVALSSRRGSNPAPPWGIGIFLSFVLGCLLLVLELSRVRVSWTDHEIVMHSPWTGEKRLLWVEVHEVTYSKTNRWFVLTAQSGTKIRVNTLLSGVREFLHDMQSRLAPEIYREARSGIEEHG